MMMMYHKNEFSDNHRRGGGCPLRSFYWLLKVAINISSVTGAKYDERVPYDGFQREDLTDVSVR